MWTTRALERTQLACPHRRPGPAGRDAGPGTAEDPATALARSATSRQLGSLFAAAVRRHGFNAFAVGYLPSTDADRAGPETGHRPFLLIDWPREWLELYAREGFAREDAALARAREEVRPFTWREFRRERPGEGARIFAAAAAFGWTDGLLVPVRAGGPGRRAGVVSLAAPHLDGLTEAARDEVAAFSLAAFRRAEELGWGSGRPKLTPRERETLALVASGFGDGEIAETLGVSRSTAHGYVESAKRKLGSATRAQAVAVALGEGALWR